MPSFPLGVRADINLVLAHFLIRGFRAFRYILSRRPARTASRYILSRRPSCRLENPAFPGKLAV
jgi:hypothetical protein